MSQPAENASLQLKAENASLQLKYAIDRLRLMGVQDGTILNALAGVSGGLIAKIAQPEFESRLVADFMRRVRGEIRR
jgi:hypothetical protein